MIYFELLIVYFVEEEHELIFFACDHPDFPKPLVETTVLSPFKGLSPLTFYVSFLLGPLLFSMGLCLPLYQYHTVLMTGTLQLVLKWGNVRPPTLFLFFNIILFICCLLNFHMNFRMNFYISVFPISCRLSNVLTYHCSQYSNNPFYFCQIINNSLLFLILVIWAFFFLFFGQSR